MKNPAVLQEFVKISSMGGALSDLPPPTWRIIPFSKPWLVSPLTAAHVGPLPNGGTTWLQCFFYLALEFTH